MKIEDRIFQSKAVFFDLFHTLFSFKSDGTKGQSTSEILGIPESIWNDLLFESSDERFRGLENDKYKIIRKLAHSYNPKINEETIRLAADLREERFAIGLRSVSKERVEALVALKTIGKKIGLISNADSIEVSGRSASPLAKLFDSVVFSYSTGVVKPEPEIYLLALDSLGVCPEDSVFVGDGGSDELRGAKEIGFTTVMTTEIIRSLWPEKIAAREAYADYTVTNLNQLTNAQPVAGGDSTR